jgi:hypothetical protein
MTETETQPTTPWYVAQMSASPAPTGDHSPPAATVTTVSSEEDHSASPVTSRLVPSENDARARRDSLLEDPRTVSATTDTGDGPVDSLPHADSTNTEHAMSALPMRTRAHEV